MDSLGDPFVTGPLGLALTLLGFYLGNRFALQRDRRKERIEVVDRLYEVLVLQAAEPSPYRTLSERDLELLTEKTPGLWRRRRVRHRVAKYQAAAKQDCTQDAVGQTFFSDPDRVKRAAAALLRECQHD